MVLSAKPRELFDKMWICKVKFGLFQMFIWFAAALYFFALSFNMNDVLGNPYLNLAVTGKPSFTL